MNLNKYKVCALTATVISENCTLKRVDINGVWCVRIMNKVYPLKDVVWQAHKGDIATGMEVRTLAGKSPVLRNLGLFAIKHKTYTATTSNMEKAKDIVNDAKGTHNGITIKEFFCTRGLRVTTETLNRLIRTAAMDLGLVVDVTRKGKQKALKVVVK